MTPGSLIFCHPSDELYGADRVLLDIIDQLPEGVRARTECWLPTDLPHGPHPLCHELDRRGVVVRHEDLPILRRAHLTPAGLFSVLRRAIRLLFLLRRAGPTIVYCTTSAAILAAPVARIAGVPAVVGHVQELWSPSEARVLGLLARACERVVVISEAVLASLPPHLHDRARVVTNATRDPGAVRPSSPLVAEGEATVRYLVAGRWNAWKGHRTLLEAWDRLDEPGELVVLGGPSSSGESVDVPGLAAALRHPDSVHIVGEVADIGQHVERADVMVVPSDKPEPFGLVAIEAFARGRPVIGSNAGGLAEIITDGRDGWLFPPGDVQTLTHVMAGLDKAVLARAGERARATYEARFTFGRFSAAWREALGDLLSRP